VCVRDHGYASMCEARIVSSPLCLCERVYERVYERLCECVYERVHERVCQSVLASVCTSVFC
jgi:hypothetical protein